MTSNTDEEMIADMNKNIAKIHEIVKGVDTSDESQAMATEIKQKLDGLTKLPITGEQLEKAATGIETLLGALFGNVDAIKSGDPSSAIIGISNIMGAICTVVPPPFGVVGGAFFSCVSMIFGASKSGPSQNELIQKMISQQTEVLEEAINQLKEYFSLTEFEEVKGILSGAMGVAKDDLFDNNLLGAGGELLGDLKLNDLMSRFADRKEVLYNAMSRLTGTLILGEETNKVNELKLRLREWRQCKEEEDHCGTMAAMAAGSENWGDWDLWKAKGYEVQQKSIAVLSKMDSPLNGARKMLSLRARCLEMYYLLAQLNRLIIASWIPLKAKFDDEDFNYDADLRKNWLDVNILRNLQYGNCPVTESWVSSAIQDYNKTIVLENRHTPVIQKATQWSPAPSYTAKYIEAIPFAGPTLAAYVNPTKPIATDQVELKNVPLIELDNIGMYIYCPTEEEFIEVCTVALVYGNSDFKPVLPTNADFFVDFDKPDEGSCAIM